MRLLAVLYAGLAYECPIVINGAVGPEKSEISTENYLYSCWKG